MEPLEIKQGTTRVIYLDQLRDATDSPLNPSGWGIHAVARLGIWGPAVAVWRDTPNTGESLAEVVPADPELDPDVVDGEKWIYLHIDPDVSDAWSWSQSVLDIEIREPSTGNKETFSTGLRLIPTTIRS